MAFTPSRSPLIDRHTTMLFWWLLIVAGIGLRLAASVLSQGFVHPDEHQQYLEVAQGIVYGPWVKFWEYDRGIRHYFYPDCLALLLLPRHVSLSQFLASGGRQPPVSCVTGG